MLAIRLKRADFWRSSAASDIVTLPYCRKRAVINYDSFLTYPFLKMVGAKMRGAAAGHVYKLTLYEILMLTKNVFARYRARIFGLSAYRPVYSPTSWLVRRGN